MKRKMNIKKIFTNLAFAFICIFSIGVMNVNAATVTVETEQQLRDAVDGVKEVDGNKVTDTDTTVVQLKNDIVLTDTLIINPITDLTLDLKGNTIDGETNSKSVSIQYGGNALETFTTGSLTIKDTGSSNTGTIKSYKEIGIGGNNYNDVAKHFALTIEGGKFYVLNTSIMLSLSDNNYYMKNTTFDFQVKDGYFETGQMYSTLLYTNNLESLSINLNVKLDKLTFKSYWSRLIYSDKEFTVNDVVSADSNVKIKFSSNSSEATVTDRTHSVSEYIAFTDVLDTYDTIEITKTDGFDVSDVTLNETYGYTAETATAVAIPIKNRGTSALKIKNVTVAGSNFKIVNGTETNLSAGATDTTWKVQANASLPKGTYTAIITVTAETADGDKQYYGNVTLNVGAKTLSGISIYVPDEITYGNSYTPTPNFGGFTGLSVSDYTITFAKKDGDTYTDIDYTPSDVGEYRAILKVTNNNYIADDATADFKIVAKTITPTIDTIADQTYTGEQITPNITVSCEGVTLTKDTDYTVEYDTNKDVGTGKVTIKAVSGRNYIFTDVEKTFNIVAKTITASDVTLTQTSYRHTGSAITPEPVVKVGEKTLVKDTDYELSYSNNTNIGDNTATVTVTGKGNYTGTVNKNFSIIEKDPQVISFADTTITKTYGDSNFTKTANHTTGDGTVTYTSTNTDVATVNATTGLVTIKKAGTTTIKATASSTADYAEETAEYTLTVNKKELSYTATVSNKEFNNNTNATVAGITFNGLVGSDTLTKDTDYTVSAVFTSTSVGNNINVNVNVTLNDTDITKNYTLASAGYVATANITGKAILESGVTVDTSTTYTYNGSTIEPNVVVKDGTTTLVKNTDYTVEYQNNINAGTGKVKVTGTGNYSGVIEKTFTINKKSITPAIDDIADVTYNGSEQKPTLTVKDGTTTLVKDRDYTVVYSDNVNAGEADAEISEVSTSNYTFTATGKSFNINKYEIKASDITLEYDRITFNNTEKRPTVTVKMGSTEISSLKYNVSYANNINVGTADVTVTIKAGDTNFEGSATVHFNIDNKTVLNITGIEDQVITYTGSPVDLVGTLQVDNGINVSDLTEKWFRGTTEIERPTNVGVYKVVYSFENDTYIGRKEVNVEITKKTSIIPSVNLYKGKAGDKLSTITLPTGFKWVNSDENITAGSKNYSITYTTNNDTTNYTTETSSIEVYGKSNVNINVSVNNGVGGEINSNKSTILEGNTATITLNPYSGYEINKVEVNGVDKTSSVVNNKLDVVAGNTDIAVVVTYKVIQYTITINDVANATVNPNSFVKVDYNTNKTFTIKADAGYKLVSVKVNGVERKDDIINDKLTLKNILANAEVVVVVERNVYEVIEGANQKYTITKNNEARFRIDADYSKFENGGKVYIDDKLVDSKYYTSKSGSTIITLKQSYVDTLSTGEHTLKVVFNDGGVATTNFTIQEVAQELDNPKTGDNIALYITTGILSVVGLIGTSVYVFRKKQEN